MEKTVLVEVRENAFRDATVAKQRHAQGGSKEKSGHNARAHEASVDDRPGSVPALATPPLTVNRILASRVFL